MKGGETVKKIAVASLIVCFIAVGLARADDIKTPIPNTIASPELFGPHYLWSAPKEDETETNIADLVKEGSITPGTEDRIKEVDDAADE